MRGLSRLGLLRLLGVIGLLVCASGMPIRIALASGCLSPTPSPDRTIDSKVGNWAVEIEAVHDCRGGVKVSVLASQPVPGDLVPGGRIQRPLGPTGTLELPIYCRRDDYAFLPPNALGGLPCLALSPTDHIDPYRLAVQLAASLPPPAVRIGMNPQKGLVAVPTWFWVEGYDGGSLANAETVLEAHERCHLVVVRNTDGSPVRTPDGRAALRRECVVETTTFSVEVQLWPKLVAWDFGDQTPGTAVACSRSSPCSPALGEPFVDARHPSPIQHPYQWSSLGVQGRPLSGDLPASVHELRGRRFQAPRHRDHLFRQPPKRVLHLGEPSGPCLRLVGDGSCGLLGVMCPLGFATESRLELLDVIGCSSGLLLR